MAQPAVEIASGTLDSERRDNVPSIVRLDVEPQATGINTITVAWDSDADLRFNVFDVANGRVTETTVRGPSPAVWSGVLDTNNTYRMSLWSRTGSGIATFVATLQAPTPDVAPIEIVSQPSDLVADEGSTASFSVTATSTKPLSYQWLADGESIEGATSSTLTIEPVTLADDGAQYSVLVTNEDIERASDSATLTVRGDLPANGIVTLGQGTLDSAGVQGPRRIELDFVPLADASHTISVSWDSDADVRFNVFNNDDERINSTAVGGTNPAVWVGDLDGSKPGYIRVWSKRESGVGQYTATLALTDSTPPLEITTQPIDADAVEGDNATFSVVATGSEPLLYQWYVTAAPPPVDDDNTVVIMPTTLISGADSSVLTLESVSLTDGGSTYLAEITDTNGESVRSDAATLRVEAAVAPTLEITADPADLTVDEGAEAIFTVTATGAEPLSYQWFANGLEIAGANDETFILGTTSADDDGTLYTVSVSSGDNVLLSGAATLTVVPSMPDDATTVALIEGTVDSERRDGELSIVNLNFTSLAAAVHTVTVSWDSDADVRFNVFKADGERVSQDTVGGSNPGVWQGVLAGDEEHFIRLWSKKGSGIANYTATVQATIPIVPFAITMGPESTNVAERQDASFSVTATGSDSLEYQWLENGNVMPAQTDDTLVLFGVTADFSGNAYSVEVSNGVETLVSEAAILTVNETLALGLFSENADTSTWMLEGPSPTLDFGGRENSAWGQVLLRIGDLLLVGGDFQGIKPSVNGAVTSQPFMAAFDAVSGQPVTSFQIPSEVDSVVRALALSLDGSRLYVGGDFGLLALNPASGELEFSVEIADGTAPGRVFDIAVSDDHLYIGGEFKQVKNADRRHLARLTLDGQLDPVWSPTVQSGFSTGRTSPVQSVTLSPSQDVVYVGGFFNRIDSTVTAQTPFGKSIGMFALSTSDGSVLPERFSADVGSDDRVLGVRDIFVTPSLVIIGWGGPNALTFHSHDGTRLQQYAAESDIQKLDVLGNYLFVGHHGEFLGPRNAPIPVEAVVSLDPKVFIPFKLHSIRLDDPSFPVEQFWRINGTFGVFGIAVTEDSLWISGQLSLVGRNERPTDGLARFSATN